MNPHKIDDIIYVQLANFLNFNIFNTLGCIVSGYIKWPNDASRKSQLILLAFSIIRIPLLPLILFCNIAPGNRKTEVNIC